MAIDIMFHKKYTIKNAVNRREPSEFIEKIIRSAKNAGFTQTRIQFDIIYNTIDVIYVVPTIFQFSIRILRI